MNKQLSGETIGRTGVREIVRVPQHLQVSQPSRSSRNEFTRFLLRLGGVAGVAFLGFAAIYFFGLGLAGRCG